ncbi:hypothetical protein H7K13_26695 [Priestia aryabhattai]|uniref:hypothetical protein n=1 Tax=Priestia aryabhattai TaxID=412384 RepID=UPI001C8DA760|nr:hypothetical protein [Priestia aryabhattai]MBY0078523.1 hypothetical protein [Priestia aryabhattai]
MKKWLIALISIICLSVTPALTPSASAASLGSFTIYVGNDMFASKSSSKTIYAKAGTVTLCAYGDTRGATTKVQVREIDKAGAIGSIVSQIPAHSYYNSCTSFKVTKAEADGSNKKAELVFHAERGDSYQKGKNVTFSVSQ